ncbi:MAG: hypothetical protein EPO28_10345 [Saprospiraceae bacterium]|nr:MAG: hypothetical protein EPO28_10345 [Saprospiraceae bacterium]
MKKLLLFSLLALLFTTAATENAFGQHSKKKKSSKTDQYFDESGFANKLWYGGTFNLGFSGSGETNQFVFGLSPMVGYKILGDIVSAGPRVGFTYNFIKGRGVDGLIHKTNPVSYNLGVFARAKAFQNFFAHFEYEYQNTKVVFVDGFGRLALDNNGDVLTASDVRDNFYIGAGYTSGGLWGYEILLLYNLTQPDSDLELPFSFRFGITYKF